MMVENHPYNFDPRPKRRKNGNNPYEIFTVGMESGDPHYYVRYKDSCSVEQCMEIDKELFELFDRFELEEISFFNEVDRHYDLSEQNEETLACHAMHQPSPVEGMILQKMDNEKLHEAIALKPP